MTAVDVCGKSKPSHRLWRNGMDFEPKKTYPPDYSNVPSVRDWQMSPFGNERYDLDEIQKAEKKGFKGRFELEMVKKRLAAEREGKKGFLREDPKEKDGRSRMAQPGGKRRIRCSTDTLYQPYGPMVISSLSHSRPYLSQPARIYSYLGPSFYSGFRFKTPAPETVSTIPCSDYASYEAKLMRNMYIPYGPYGELRITPDLYTPMGPSILPVDLSF